MYRLCSDLDGGFTEQGFLDVGPLDEKRDDSIIILLVGVGGKCFPVLAMLFAFLLPVIFFKARGIFGCFLDLFFAGGLFLAVYNGIHPCFCSPFFQAIL